MSEKNKKVGTECGGCFSHGCYSDVGVSLICHKCGKGMRFSRTKRECEHCGHTVGAMPTYNKDTNTFEVVV